MNIFDTIKKQQQSGTSSLLSRLQQKVSLEGNPLDGHSKRLFSLESASPDERESAMNAVEELDSNLREVLREEQAENNVEYSETQQEAAISAAAAFTARPEILKRTAVKPVAGEHETVIPSHVMGGGEADVGRVREALEAYDNTENRNSMMITFTYNLKTARQNDFGEAFFPTVVVSPDVAGVTIVVDLLAVQEDKKRAIDGSYDYMFHQKSLVNALVYPTILNNDTTRIYPVVLDGVPRSLENFVDPSDVAPYTVELENGERVKTAPLKVGKEFDLIGLGSPDYLINNGALDFTDQLDPHVALQDVYVKLSGGEVIVFSNLEVIPEANFTYAVQGNSRTMNLNFDFRYAKVDQFTKTHDGSDITGNPVIDTKAVANLHLRLYGSVNLNTGLGQLTAGDVGVSSVFSASKDKLDLTTGAGKTAADAFADAKIIGYNLKARRINTNHRERGQLLDLQRERLVYTLPILAPISIVRPTSDDTSDDAARLDSLITATYVRCSNAAVSTLLSAEKHLAQVVANGDPEPEMLYKSQTLGAARFFVTPHYKNIKLDVRGELNTLKSSDRIVDVQAVLVNTIRELVYDGYLKSNYKSVASVLQGENGNKKPTVIVGTDPYIAAYLMVAGDIRTLGEEFNVKVVSTADMRMRGKIVIAFGKTNQSSNDVANPLHFGNMFWRPELVSVLPISRGGQTSRELTVQPSFLHVVHCPVMMTIDVTNLPDAVTKMSPVFTKAS